MFCQLRRRLEIPLASRALSAQELVSLDSDFDVISNRMSMGDVWEKIDGNIFECFWTMRAAENYLKENCLITSVINQVLPVN